LRILIKGGKMKHLQLLLAFLLIGGISHVMAQEQGKSVSIEADTDTVIYDLIIFDTGFESWLLTEISMTYHTNAYYKLWNQRYVSEWNSRFMSEAAKYPEIENYIDYNSTLDYGIELNYRLYMYFNYFEEKNDITLVQRR
jgi:hypothetical protein